MNAVYNKENKVSDVITLIIEASVALFVIFCCSLVIIGNVLKSNDLKSCDLVELIPFSSEDSRPAYFTGAYGGRVHSSTDWIRYYTWEQDGQTCGFSMFITYDGDCHLPDAIVVRRNEETGRYWYLSEDNPDVLSCITVWPLTNEGRMEVQTFFDK